MNNMLQKAKKLGIAEGYWDIVGNRHQTSEETLRYFINALSTTDKQSTDFDDVFLLSANQSQTLQLPTEYSTYTLCDEQQTVIAQENVRVAEKWQCPALSAGYYTLTTIINATNTDTSNNSTAQSEQRYRLIVAPPTCYAPEALDNQQLRGLMLQLYSLRSDTRHSELSANWGIGDFADLLDAVDLAGEQNFDFIGLNPLHALYPSQPQWFSPYSPSSRIYLHWLYLSIGLIPEFVHHPACIEWFHQHQATIDTLRQSELVDYQQVAKLKMQALQLAFSHFDRSAQKDNQHQKSDKTPLNQKRHADFEHFIQQGGESLRCNSAFYAISEKYADGDTKQSGHSLGYLAFPTDLQSVNSPKVQQFIREHADKVRFYSYLQWLIDEQLTLVQQRCEDRRLALGLYGDLAVGVARGSADSWANPALYSLPASIGAPPDPLGPVGQNWGLPPMHPMALKRQGFQLMIDTLRANMKHCGVLRIDHVMGLYRLWLIPDGKSNGEGAYIHYPFDMLMAILAIESQRAQCLVVGEDLGTVPDEVRAALNKYRVLSYDVLYFAGKEEQHGQSRWRSPCHVKQAALGVLGTHDLPPLTAWWHCNDLHLLRELGILSEADLKPLFDARLHDKQALLNALKMDGYLPDNYEIDALKMAMHPQLNHAIHAYVRDGKTQLFGIQPENFCGVEQAFNVPGTTDEAPNWRLKLPCALKQINMVF